MNLEKRIKTASDEIMKDSLTLLRKSFPDLSGKKLCLLHASIMDEIGRCSVEAYAKEFDRIEIPKKKR